MSDSEKQARQSFDRTVTAAKAETDQAYAQIIPAVAMLLEHVDNPAEAAGIVAALARAAAVVSYGVIGSTLDMGARRQADLEWLAAQAWSEVTSDHRQILELLKLRGESVPDALQRMDDEIAKAQGEPDLPPAVELEGCECETCEARERCDMDAAVRWRAQNAVDEPEEPEAGKCTGSSKPDVPIGQFLKSLGHMTKGGDA